MLTPEYLKTCGDNLVLLYQQLEDDIVRDAARRIVKMDFVTDSARWQVERLQQSGAVYEDIVKSLSKYTGKSEREVKKLLETSSVQSLAYDDAIYKKAGLLPTPLSGSPLLMQHITAAASKTSNTFKNLTMTTAIKTQTDFINACDRAYMQVSSGTLDYVTAVKWAVKSVSRTGASVLYPSGKSDKLDVAVRRAALTGVSQTGNELQILRMDEMGCALVETTAHFGARPSHAVWQGRVFSRNGDVSKYPDFILSTGYGTGAGLGGWNCRHGFFPFFEGFSQRVYTDHQLRDRMERTVTYNGQTYTDYEASQIQRKFERTIRAKKRELVGFDAAADTSGDGRVVNAAKAEFASTSVKLKATEAQLTDFLRQTGRDKEAARHQVQGFGRSQAQKAVWANRKEVEKYSRLRYNKDGTIVVTDDWKGKRHPKVPKEYKTNAVIETVSVNGNAAQVDRTIYGPDGIMIKQIHSGPHGNQKNHPYGKHGEHRHDYIWPDGSKTPSRTTADLTDHDRKEHDDIL